MRIESLSPDSQNLLLQALPAGELVNVLYEQGARVEAGLARERRCFALSKGGWLDFCSWEGAPAAAQCVTRWALTDRARALLTDADTRRAAA